MNPFQKISLLLVLTGLMIGFACSKAGKEAEWVNLMPGENLEGWTVLPIPPEGTLSDTLQWSMNTETGILRCSGKGGHDWLKYDQQEFADFIFHVEWRFEKIAEPAKYNSGVFVRNSADGKIWHQAQMGSESGGYLFGNSLIRGKIQRENTRDQIQTNPVKSAGEWNTFEITGQGNQIKLVVNDVPTTVWDDCEMLKGYIGLEAEGYAVEFRNLKIKAF